MSGTEQTLAARSALWAALSSMKLGRPGAEWRYEAELDERNGWSADHAARVVREYRRFLFLAATAGQEVTPSRAVDQAWHLHLEDEDHYRAELCGRILGRTLDHRTGSGGAADEARFRSQYADTLALYRETFGDPPRDIWPLPAAPVWEPASASAGRYDLPRIVFGLGALAAAMLPALDGKHLPALILIAFGLFCLAPLMLELAGLGGRRRKSRDGSSGGSCGGGGGSSSRDSDGDGGDAGSCGGGCGGD